MAVIRENPFRLKARTAAARKRVEDSGVQIGHQVKIGYKITGTAGTHVGEVKGRLVEMRDTLISVVDNHKVFNQFHILQVTSIEKEEL